MSGEVPTGNPWDGLSEYTRTHTGGPDALRFEPQVARDLAAAGSQVIMGINGLRDYLTDLAAGRPVSSLSSGTALGTRFGQKATQLDGILNDHKAILTDMIDTFVAAGKAYGDVDGFNSDLLDNIQSNPTEKWELDGYPSTTPPPTTTLTATAGTLPNSLTTLTGFESTTIMGESADGLDWPALWGVGNHIRVNQVVGNLSNQSGGWRWVGSELDGIFVDFVNKVDSVTAEQWKGPGKEIAVAAVKAYANAVPQLSAGARGVGDLLFFTAGWLDSTQRSMPTSPTNPSLGLYVVPPPAGSNDLALYRQNFRTTYLAGLGLSTSHIPVLPAADGAFGRIPNPFYKGNNGNNNGNNGNNGGGNNGGGNNGGGGETGGGETGGGQNGDGENGGNNGGGEGLAPGVREQFGDTGGLGDPAGTMPGALGKFGGDFGGGTTDPIAGDPNSYGQQLASLVSGGLVPGQVPGQQKLAGGARELAERVGSLVPGSPEERQFFQTLVQQLLAAAQQGLPQLQQAFEQFAQFLTPDQQRELLDRAGLTGIPGIDIPGSGDPNDLAGFAAKLAGGAGGGGAGGGGGGGFGAPAAVLAHDPTGSSKLFPRAAAFVPISASTQFDAASPAAALAGTQGTPGTPGAAGAAGAGAGQGNNQHRRATYLESSDYLEDAIGDAPVVVKPVVER
ncbi:hypothetical protein OG225_38660 [Nocardia sp. NBC_01377]|uniref:hypothetical protein n=1 Tax=Nocardia sp. NBC_01377 TaxID=2903595 RepID=UPI00324FC883